MMRFLETVASKDLDKDMHMFGIDPFMTCKKSSADLEQS